MANTDNQPDLLSESINKEDDGLISVSHTQAHDGHPSASEDNDKQSETPSATSSSVPAKDPDMSISAPASTAETRPATCPTRPTLVQLGSSTTQPSSSTSPHPHKKFNAVNINKKFLEKNSPAAMATATSASTMSKASTSMSRSQIQSTQSHSRLVTAKLTGSPIPSATTGPGWSRPNSTAPSSTGTNSPIGSSPLPSAATAVSLNTAAPQLPHVGKVIQPQPRAAALQNTNLQKDGNSLKASAKLAWNSVKPPLVTPIITSNDFPTAAEVAQATAPRKFKQDDPKSPQESIPGAKDRLEDEADTFRGVHLDPNAHHWGEMEEDNDDDFLGGVIEFGDGRQYKVEATELPSSTPSLNDGPVTKEQRFVDDFDRSWPKSKPSPGSSPQEITATSPVSSVQGGSVQGQDLHPHLFNERSNRLEPYSSRPVQPGYQNRRGSHNDGSVQVLQKPGSNDLPPRPRVAGGPPPRPGFSGHPDRRDAGPRRDHPPSPRATRGGDWAHPHDMAPSSSLPGRDREPSERGRRSDMGPPPIPSHATRRPSQDRGHQLPPHLSPNPPVPRRLPSRDPMSPQSSRFAPPSPALSHTSTLILSPGGAPTIALPGADLNEVTKDLMQTAAARAKARKQQEEAEREAQRERARKKALELEEKMKVAEAEKVKKEQDEKELKDEKESKDAEENKAVKGMFQEQEKEVVDFIQSAVDSVEGLKSPLAARRPSIDATSLPKSLPRRPPSLRGQQRRAPPETGAGARRPSFGVVGARVSGTEVSPAVQAESWRAKANPLPPRQTHSQPPHVLSESSAQPPPAPLSSTPSTALEQVANIAENSISELEVVEFSNMSEFVGDGEKEVDYVETAVVEKVEIDAVSSGLPQKPRPTASDFFEDTRTSVPASKGAEVWKRKVSADVEEKSRVVSSKDETTTRPPAAAKEVSPPHVPPHPRSRVHAEASMSALDDVMSRIRGAMQANGANSKESRTSTHPSEPDHPPTSHRTSNPSPSVVKSSPLRERWTPPTKSRIEENIGQLRESPHTSSEPSYTPVAAKLTVDLPKVSHHIENVPRRQQVLFSNPPLPVRFELLSFQPPVQGMSKRDLSVNSVLFRQTPGFKSNKIRVALPRSKSGPVIPRMVNMVGTKVNNAGAFGKPTNADGAMSWRRPLPTNVVEKDEKKQEEKVPEAVKDPEEQASEISIEPPEEHRPHTRTRQPKMPTGSVVAFMRDSRIDAVEADPKPLVNFIVTSELDDPGDNTFGLAGAPEDEKLTLQARSENGLGGASIGSTPLSEVTTAEPHPTQPASLTLSSKVSAGKPPDNTARSGISGSSPSHQSATSAPWARASLNVPVKDSSARAPDPEHLKAVWSQPANKTDFNPVNSLEGIADDMTTVPLSIQEFKSEDGETPPPALPATTSRLSLHDVTKAFQKVPSPSSSNSNHNRNPISSPSSNNTPVTRSPYPYSPMPPNHTRSPYEYSPMISHSPSPTVIYPHQLAPSPVPNRMPVNGHAHAQMYQTPIWIHQPPPSTPGNHGNVMRPMMSPYTTAMMPYPSPNAPMYMSTLSAPQPPVGTAAGRGRGIPMMSPAMTHAHAPMYAGSPVMMHAQPVPHQNYTAYMGVHPSPVPAPGRGQPRADMSQAPPQPAANPTTQQSHHTPTYNSTSYVRSTW